MTYAPTSPLEVPPYEVQGIIPSISCSANGAVVCAQALGSEIYVGCLNGELLRYTLQADDPNQLESYRLLSRQSVPNHKPIDDIVLVPCISRALILSDRQIHFYVLPSLDPVSQNIMKPIRNVVTFAVDHQHLKRPPPSSFGNSSVDTQPVEFCVIKRTAMSMYTLRERLLFQKEIPLPQGTTLARRTGHHLCVADKEHYNLIDLEKASLFPVIPLSQSLEPSPEPIKPIITVISDHEFLILSFTGSGSIGVFITDQGDPVRGTLEWPSHPEDSCLDYPYIATLLKNNTIEVHNIETQSLVQVIPSPPGRLAQRLRLASCLNGYLVPSSPKSDKRRMVSVPLLRDAGAVGEKTIKSEKPMGE